MTNNRISPARQYEAKRDPDHPKICARCQLVWREYSPARDPHCHCFDYEYEDERREMERIEGRRRFMEDADERSKAKQRIVELGRLVKDALEYVAMAELAVDRDSWRFGVRNWLARYREMFPPEVK